MIFFRSCVLKQDPNYAIFQHGDLTQSNSVHGEMFKVYPKGCDTLDAEANLDTYNLDCFTKVGRSVFHLELYNRA